jgi:hypothetical protein
VYKSESTRYTNKQVLDIKQMNTTTEEYTKHGTQVFVSSGTFTVPLGVTTIYITGCAAGGNGAAGSVYGGGGGGGGGEWAYKNPLSVVPGSSYTVTIGAVGAVTSIGSFQLNYGANGVARGSGTGGTGGAGGSLSMGRGAGGSGGDFYGRPGQNGLATGGTCNSDSAQGGGGGGGSFGGGGNSTDSIAGLNGGYGGGGGGGCTSGSAAGGSGGPGILIIEW